jgi:hypothetical protein
MEEHQNFVSNLNFEIWPSSAEKLRREIPSEFKYSTEADL